MRSSSGLAALATAATGFAVLAGLVAAGSLAGLDQWAVDHAMPGAHGGGRTPTLLESAVPLLHARWSSGWGVAANLVTLPGQALVSFLLVGACCLALRRFGLLAAWLGGNAVEVLCKSVLERPPLHRGALHLAAFDSSFPSGHTLRIVLVAVALGLVRPRARPLLAAWAAAAIVLLELAGHHVPSDIAGGLLLAGGLVAVALRR